MDDNKIVSFTEEEIRERLKNERSAHPAQLQIDPTEEDLLEIPAMTEEELDRMVPWRDRKKQTATV
jgi:hypothetical protein